MLFFGIRLTGSRFVKNAIVAKLQRKTVGLATGYARGRVGKKSRAKANETAPLSGFLCVQNFRFSGCLPGCELFPVVGWRHEWPGICLRSFAPGWLRWSDCPVEYRNGERARLRFACADLRGRSSRENRPPCFGLPAGECSAVVVYSSRPKGECKAHGTPGEFAHGRKQRGLFLLVAAGRGL